MRELAHDLWELRRPFDFDSSDACVLGAVVDRCRWVGEIEMTAVMAFLLNEHQHAIGHVSGRENRKSALGP